MDCDIIVSPMTVFHTRESERLNRQTSDAELVQHSYRFQAALSFTADGSARFAWTTAIETSFDPLMGVLALAPVLRTFDPARRVILTTYAT